VKRLLLAIQFLTIIPVRVGGNVTERDMAGATVFFPAAGAVQGAVAALTAFTVMKFFPAEPAAALTLCALIFSNGGFDLDGLMDTFDSLAVKSVGDRQKDMDRRLSVMKDSSVGAVGVIGLVMALLLKYALIVTLLRSSSPYNACSLIFVMTVLGRWVTVPAMYHARPARLDGLGSIFIGKLGLSDVVLSSLLSLVFSAAALCGVMGFGPALGFLFPAVCLLLLYLFVIAALHFFDSRFGGLTGDHCGALTETSEIMFLMGTYLWLRHFI